MNAHGIVTLYPKIIMQDKTVICSQDCSRATKRNDYTVAFTDPERPSKVRYGRVCKFLSCPADSPDSIHVAIIEELTVQRCAELNSLKFPPEIQSLSDLVCSDFFSAFAEGHKLALPLEHIMSKCFDVSTNNLCIVTCVVSHSEVLT